MILEILTYPDPRLHQKSKPVENFDTELQELVENMTETMRFANGIGLAAPQVAVFKRLIVVEIPLDEDQVEFYAICNPIIEEKNGDAKIEEGCLSVPGFTVEVDRARDIILTGQDPKGAPIRMEATGLLSICLQHELDHLDGKLLVNYVSPLKRDLYKKQLQKGFAGSTPNL